MADAVSVFPQRAIFGNRKRHSNVIHEGFVKQSSAAKGMPNTMTAKFVGTCVGDIESAKVETMKRTGHGCKQSGGVRKQYAGNARSPR